MIGESYAQLIAEHDEIDRQCQDLIRLADAGSASGSDLSARLDRLATTIADHLAVEEPLLSNLLRRASKPETIADVEAMEADLEVLKRDWRDYLATWSAETITADGEAFCATSRAMLSRVRARVARESSMMYAAFLQTSIISLRTR